MTTCPSGVDYRRLVDHARYHVERTYDRPLVDRIQRATLAFVMPRPWAFRLSLLAANLARPFAWMLPKRLKVMVELAPSRMRPAAAESAQTPRRLAATPPLKIALRPNCVQQVLAPGINAAAARLLARLGAEVIEGPAPVCCGSIAHHLGKEEPALAKARAAIDVWTALMDGPGLDRIAITVSGCGATIKDYAFMLAHDPAYADKAARVAAIARDVSELAAELGLPDAMTGAGRRVAYQGPCTLQHGQKIDAGPRALLQQAGFILTPVAEAHLCCGSAGTYNLMQPEISAELKRRKVETLEARAPQVIAAGNIGCMVQIGSGTAVPVVHTVELLDWALGGPKPAKLGPEPR
jgi:glycolate oxidase iron-sulfur subunit